MIRKVNIKKTTDSRYRNPWQVRWRDPSGKQKKLSFPTKGMAQRYAKEIWGNINASLYHIQPKDWDNMVSEFLAAKEGGDRLASETINIYRRVLAAFRTAAGSGAAKSDRIQIGHIDRYKQDIAKNGAPTVNKKLRHLSAFFNWAVKRKYMAENPVPNAGKLKEVKKTPTIITPEEFQKVLKLCNPQWAMLALLGLHGVARKASLAALNVADVDFDAGTVRAYDTKQKQYRVTPLHSTTIARLSKYIKSLPVGETRLFTAKFHYTTWNRIVAEAGVSPVKFHHLRTCMSTWLKKAGVSDGVVTSILGHSDPSVTTKYYTALDDIETKKAALDKLPL